MSIKIDSDDNGLLALSSVSNDDIVVLDADEHLVQLSGSNIQVVADTATIYDINIKPNIIWDKVGERVYETGLDKGVLYLPNGSAVPWNGLTSVVEKFDKEVSPVYYDGQKINDIITLGDFAGTLKAVTYPDEFVELEGIGSVRRGIFVGDQKPKSFGLSYRVLIGNDIDGVVGYKIHLLYNVTALPTDTTYASLSDGPSLVEFEWDISAVPEEVPGFRPTAHFIINSLDIDPWLLAELEEILYGSVTESASLMPMADLITFINSWYRVKIIDNGDGTWTAITLRDGFIEFFDNDVFDIINVNAIYLDEDTYVISDTTDDADLPEIKITNNGNGTWTASTDHDNLIVIGPDGLTEIFDANAVDMGEGAYQIANTPES